MKKKRTIIAISAVLAVVIILIAIVFILRLSSASFRYSFDLIFNQCDYFTAHVEGQNGQNTAYQLSLPEKTAEAYRTSDTSMVFCTKNSYQEFIGFYEENGYDVTNETVTGSDGITYKIAVPDSVQGNGTNYYFVSIELDVATVN